MHYSASCGKNFSLLAVALLTTAVVVTKPQEEGHSASKK